MITVDRVTKIVSDKANELGAFLVSIKVSAQNEIQVFVDKADGVSINECLQISRFIEEELDREIEDFQLVVSSPGLTNAFVVEEQYIKNIGNEVAVKLKDGRKIKGKLMAFDGNITLSTAKKEQNNKQTKINEEIISSEQVKETKLIVKF